jgi:hypothetical protein
MKLVTPLVIAALVIAGAVIGYTLYFQHQKLQQERAVTALVADTTRQLRQALTATPTQQMFSRIDADLRALNAPRQPELADAAEHYILGAREIVRRRLEAARLAQQAAAGRQTLTAHINAAGDRRGEAWFRTALDLKKKVERDHFDLDVTLKALYDLLGSLPDAEKRLTPFAALLIEEPLREQAREQARADAERAAAELERVRRLAEPR